MNLNNLLCKHFDEEKKGYVELSDIIQSSAPYIIMLGVAMFAVYCIYRFFKAGGFNNQNNVFPSYEIVGGAIIVFGLMVVGLVILIVISEVLKSIWHIKIAKCPLKDDDNK